MAELTIRPEDIRQALDTAVSTYQAGSTDREEIGRVTESADGIARVEGLPNVMANELVRFENGELGLALNLELSEVGVVVLGEFFGIAEGQEVRRTGEVLSVPVGDGYLGRVVDPTGAPIDGLGTIDTVGPPRPGTPGSRRHAAQERQGAPGDRDQGHRRHDPDRPRSASADHR